MERKEFKKQKFLFVAPYEGLGKQYLKVMDKYPQFSTDVVMGNLEEGVRLAKEHLQTGSYSLIISRGGTSERIKEITGLPVIQVPITTSDVLLALKLAERYTDKFAVVGYPSITKYAFELKELLQRDYEIISINDAEQIEKILLELKQRGISMILGDFITYNTAKALGINSVMIFSSEESIEIAVHQAIAVTETLIDASNKVKLLKYIISTRQAYFVVVDYNYQIIEVSLPMEVNEQELFTIIHSDLPFFLSENKKFTTHHVGQDLLVFRATKFVLQDEYLIINIFIKDRNEITKNQGIELIGDHIKNPSIFHSTSTSLGKVERLLNSYRDTSKVVVLIGEEGVGKLAAARTLHNLSTHQNKPYYIIDCYRAQTSSIQIDTSQFVTSNSKGTSIIFNNFQDGSPVIQEQILKFIEQDRAKNKNRFYITICSQPCEAEHKTNLNKLIQKLSKAVPYITIELPPLRERKEDLLNLITIYLGEFREFYNKPVTGFKNAAIDRLVDYDWPGNMIQFKRVLEELCLQASSYYILEDQVNEILEKENRIYKQKEKLNAHPFIDLEKPMHEITREIVEIVLQQEDMNKSKTAERLGIGRSTVWRILKSESTD